MRKSPYTISGNIQTSFLPKKLDLGEVKFIWLLLFCYFMQILSFLVFHCLNIFWSYLNEPQRHSQIGIKKMSHRIVLNYYVSQHKYMLTLYMHQPSAFWGWEAFRLKFFMVLCLKPEQMFLSFLVPDLASTSPFWSLRKLQSSLVAAGVELAGGEDRGGKDVKMTHFKSASHGRQKPPPGR